ncbi:hypothetical protein PAMA_018316 [Pampus argenteus]
MEDQCNVPQLVSLSYIFDQPFIRTLTPWGLTLNLTSTTQLLVSDADTPGGLMEVNSNQTRSTQLTALQREPAVSLKFAWLMVIHPCMPQRNGCPLVVRESQFKHFERSSTKRASRVFGQMCRKQGHSLGRISDGSFWADSTVLSTEDIKNTRCMLFFQEHEVEKMFTLKSGRLPSADVKNIIFFVRPRLELMDIIAENVFSEDKMHSPRDFHILFVPRRSMLCEQRLKEQGVLGSFINIDEYILDLIPYDGDLLSMEYESAFRECYLENDQTSLYHTAKGLMTLQALYGTIPQIYGKGDCARHVANMMLRMKREFAGSQNQILPVFDTLLLLDRNVDLLTPLATQLTYEGLIDEIYGINNGQGYVKLPPEKFAQKRQGEGSKDLPTEAKKLQLNSAEELYAEIRDKNFNAVGAALSKKAKIISAAFEERHNAKTVGEIKQFVSQLPHMQAARSSLANHTSIAELIKDITTSEAFFDNLTVEQEFMTGVDTDKVNTYIEDCIAQKDPLIKILRLVCMQSVCNNGLKQKVFDYYKREILQVQ